MTDEFFASTIVDFSKRKEVDIKDTYRLVLKERKEIEDWKARK